MYNQNLLRGLFLAALALAFALGATRLSVGDFARAGPGLFPLMVSGLLLVLAIIMIVRSRVIAAEPFHFSVRNISSIMLALASFVVITKLVNMMAGIVALVFVGSFAATSWSWKRNLQISVVLILIAIGFQKLLGLNLRVI